MCQFSICITIYCLMCQKSKRIPPNCSWFAVTVPEINVCPGESGLSYGIETSAGQIPALGSKDSLSRGALAACLQEEEGRMGVKDGGRPENRSYNSLEPCVHSAPSSFSWAKSGVGSGNVIALVRLSWTECCLQNLRIRETNGPDCDTKGIKRIGR